jgi:RNA polymerase sigma factor (sigma-70 family)
MAADDSDFNALMRRVAGGSEQAVWELLDRYSKNILRAVRRHMPAEIRSKVDSVDIVQSVWKSVLKKGSGLNELNTPAQLFAYVASMARLKVFETHRHFTKQARRNVRREIDLGETDPANPDHGLAAEHIDRRADRPSTIVQAQENWQLAMKRLGPRAELVVTMRMQGSTLDEIVNHTGLSKSSVRRLLLSMLKSLEV